MSCHFIWNYNIFIIFYHSGLDVFHGILVYLHKGETIAGVAESITIFGEKIESVPSLNSVTFMFQNFEQSVNFSNIC